MPFFDILRADLVLRDLDFRQILSLTHLLSLLKNDILLAQPSQVNIVAPPLVLPPAIVKFISDTTNLSEDNIKSCWAALKEEVWVLPTPAKFSAKEEDQFRVHGWKCGLSKLARCINTLQRTNIS
ncbi:hypothetical protein C8J57DRAFT_1532130 [Mycena rebaudengoi]|nr:hypothetical protein C8J57DRAFT_1532130 [Mycena rebaudengoi]